jgi:putative redox protein
MGGYEATIRTARDDQAAVDPAGVILKHHRAGGAQVEADLLTGGHLLHLAVAGCLFNDILRTAEERDITVHELEVSADGSFEGEPAVSTGVAYSVRLAADASDDDLRQLVLEAEAEASIGHTLRRGTPVEAGDIQIRGSG